MKFKIEPTGYEKTILSDLQGAWNVFRQTVVDNVGFEGWEKVLFHTDEAMSWETVRNLKLMPPPGHYHPQSLFPRQCPRKGHTCFE